MSPEVSPAFFMTPSLFLITKGYTPPSLANAYMYKIASLNVLLQEKWTVNYESVMSDGWRSQSTCFTLAYRLATQPSQNGTLQIGQLVLEGPYVGSFKANGSWASLRFSLRDLHCRYACGTQ
jgi:hypothetical protein